MVILYDFLFLAIVIFSLPAYIMGGKFHPGFSLRFGRLPRGQTFARPIWIHAVSVGEAMSVRGLVAALRQSYPGRQFIFTTVTPTGNTIIQKIAACGDCVTYLPFDFSFTVRRFIRAVQPSVCILAETELWPNLITHLSRQGIPVVVVNARISDRSLRGYSCVRFLAKDILNKVHTFAVQTERDAVRLAGLGVGRHKLQLSGNIKFDIERIPHVLEAAQTLREHAGGTGIVWVAASTHPGEDEVIVRVYRRLHADFPGVRLLIAPRHPRRSEQIAAIAKSLGFPSLFISQLDRLPQTRHLQPIFILDTIGQLVPFYTIADIVFVGGSLVKKGGHNILEAAAMGKPVLFGPHMFNFRDIADLFLQHQAAIMVANERELEDKIRYLLGHATQIQAMTGKAKALIESNRGATARTVQLIQDICAHTCTL